MLHGVTSSCHAGDYLEKKGGDCCPHSCLGQPITAELSSAWSAVPRDRKGPQASGHLLPLEALKKILDHGLWSKICKSSFPLFSGPSPLSLSSLSFHSPFACSLLPSSIACLSLFPLLVCLQAVCWARPSLEEQPYIWEHHLLTGKLERVLNHHVAKGELFDKCVWSFCVLPQCPISKAVLKSGRSSPGGCIFWSWTEK